MQALESILVPLAPPGPDRPSAAPGEDPALAYVLRLAELLHAYGTPAHRLERVLTRSAADVGIRAQFMATPTGLFAAFGEGEDQRAHLLRVDPGEVDLGKVVEFDEIMDEVEAGLDPAAGLERLEAIAAAPPRYGRIATTLAFGLASGTAAVFFGGGWPELALSVALGLVTGGIALLVRRSADLARLFEPLAAFVATFLALAFARVVLPVSDDLVALASIIVLVPGLSLTVAMIELASRHLVSGTARLAGAGTVFLTIALGVALARAVGGILFGPATGGGAGPLPAGAMWVALAIAPVAFGVLFQARVRELGWVLASGALGFLGARFGSIALGPELGAYLGALVVGLFSNSYARLQNHPASVPLLPGILLLVPGSIGFEAVTLFLAQDATAGMESAFRMALVAVALVGGLLTANTLLQPRRSL